MPIPVHSANWDPPRLHILWPKWHKTFPHQVDITGSPLPSPSQTLSKKGQWTTVHWQHQQKGCNVFFHKTLTSGHWEVFERYALLSTAPLPDTPAVSWLLDQALLLCRWPLRASCPRFGASSTGTLELTSFSPHPGKCPLQEQSSKASSYTSSHHQAMPRFSDFH